MDTADRSTFAPGGENKIRTVVFAVMASCPHCSEPLELSIEPAEITVHRDGSSRDIEPDVFKCYSCEAVLFATVSRELEET